MKSIFKGLGLIISTIAAFAATGCAKSTPVNDATNDQSSAETTEPLPDSAATPVAIYGMPAVEDESEDSNLPVAEENGVMALYGMPDTFETNDQ